MNKFELNYWQLHNHELFASLDQAEIADLLDIAVLDHCIQRNIIYPYNKKIDRIYLLLQGRIKIACQINKGVEVVLEILKEGDVFGELTMKKSVNSQCEFAEVLSNTALVCSFSLHDFENLLIQNKKLNINFSKKVGEKLKIISGKYCDLVFKDVKNRVLNFFILHARYEGKWTGNKAEINMYCTHQDIANFTASKRQTVTTIINNLVKENKIIYEGRSKVIIPDIQKLTNNSSFVEDNLKG